MRKLMWFAAGFGLAALIGMYFLAEAWYFLAAGAAALLLAVALCLMSRFPKVRLAAAVLLGCVVGFCWMFLFDSVYLSVPRAADGQALEMTVTVLDYPEETSSGCAVSGVGYLNGKPYRMWVQLPKVMELQPGDRLTCRFFLRASLPGGSGKSEYNTSQGVFLSARAYRTPDWSRPEKTPWFAYPAVVRQTVKEALAAALPQDAAGFAVALLLGDTEGIDYETDVAFKISGIRHIIAVSGLHVTILFSLLYTLMGKRRIPAVLIGIPVLFFFAAVAGFSPSVTRACLMHSLMAVALLFGKEYDPPTALGFAVLVILAVNPWTVTHVGFQMSVACLVGIFIFEPMVSRWFMDEKRFGGLKGKKRRLANWFASSVGVSLGATITVTPLCTWYFGMVSLVGVLTNLLTLWVITYIFYGLLLVCLLALIWLPMGHLMGLLVTLPIRYVLFTAKTIAKFPLAAVYTNSVYIVAWLGFAYILLAVHLLVKKKQPLTFGCCAVVGLCVALMASWQEPLRDECRVTVLDVGQGRCVILQSEGKTFLVDCGGESDTKTADLAASELLSQGLGAIDGLILTHYDRDHAGAAPYFLSRVPAKMRYLPNCNDGDGTSDAIKSQGGAFVTVEEILCITYGNTKITLIPSQRNLSDNESGMCVLFQTENCDILITGDRSTTGELELLRSVQLPQLELLIVGHHGSKYSTSQALLDVTCPETAIISVGQDNFYGHPSEEALQRLTEAGCVVFRTDQNGTIVFRGNDRGEGRK